jgi:hypothetical protein
MGIYGSSRYEADRIAIDLFQISFTASWVGAEGDKVGRWGRGGVVGGFSAAHGNWWCAT